MTLLLFLAVLSLLIFVHELGHFLMAKRFGVRVEEFGFGLPPRIFGKKIGATLYSINLFPLGGFVKLHGDTADPSAAGQASGGEVLGWGESESFAVKNKRKRAAIVLAGVLGNLLLAWLIFTLLYLTGFPKVTGEVKVLEVAPGSPAAVAELKSGDYLLRVENKDIEDVAALLQTVKDKAGQTITLVVREGKEGGRREVSLVPRLQPPPGEGPLGVRLATEGRLTYEKVSLPEVIPAALRETGQTLKMITLAFGRMLQDLVWRRAVPQDLTGVVGLYSLTGEAAARGWPIVGYLVAVVNLNLFLVNLLPIPALDGGRLLFIGVEAVRRRKISPALERKINNAGFAFLLLIFLLVTLRDVSRLRLFG